MKKVITYGTFDLFHRGHYNMLKRAKEYGDYLIVGVTGENYDIGRGKLSVKDSIAQRIENVKNTGLVDKIIVEEYLGQKIDDIVKYGVDTFVIGDDWKGKFDHLSRYCKMVYLERTKGVSSTQIREESFANYRIGIATDFPDDNQLIEEAKKVSGFSVKSVFSEDADVLEKFTEKYEVENAYTDFDEFLDDSDIVFVKSKLPERTTHIYKALEKGKHVIYDPPAAQTVEEMKKIYNKAKENKLIILSNLKMVHIHVFNQLLWMTQGGLIGDVVSFNCSISRLDRNVGNIFFNLLAIALCPMVKVMGKDFIEKDCKLIVDDAGVQFASLSFNYSNARAVLSVGNRVRTRNHLEIVGTEGTIHIDNNWWRGSYFEINKPDTDEKEIYNTNYQGNGFKYLIKAMATMMENGRYESMGLFKDESLKIVEIIEYISKMSKPVQETQKKDK